MSEIRGSQSEIAEVPFNAHQKQTALGVLMLVGVQDVRVVAVQKIGDRRDDPFAVRTIDQEDGGVFHRQALSCDLRPLTILHPPPVRLSQGDHVSKKIPSPRSRSYSAVASGRLAAPRAPIPSSRCGWNSVCLG